MNFVRFSSWAEISECGRYTVCAARSDSRWKFQAWRRSSNPDEMATLLGAHNIAQDARDLCELDADKRKAEAA